MVFLLSITSFEFRNQAYFCYFNYTTSFKVHLYLYKYRHSIWLSDTSSMDK